MTTDGTTAQADSTPTTFDQIVDALIPLANDDASVRLALCEALVAWEERRIEQLKKAVEYSIKKLEHVRALADVARQMAARETAATTNQADTTN